MPSVSNISIGVNMAAAAANKARHGMNESITRLSTGVRAMYGADAASHSMGKSIQAIGKSYAQAARNVEDGISYAQMGESVLLEVANLAIRLRELGIAGVNQRLGLNFEQELINANQYSALEAERELIFDAINNILDNTKFNGVAVVDSNNAQQVNVAYGSLTANVFAVGPNKSMEPLGSSAGGAPYFDVAVFVLADTVLAEVSEGLGNIAADLTAL